MSMAAHSAPPLLRDGDRLTADEFLRRWEAMPDLKHAELIDGIVYMASPVSRPHSDFHGTLTAWVVNYAAQTPGCHASLEATWLMGGRNVPSPDNTLRILPEWGGQSKDRGSYSAGAPELIVEVAASSRSRDLGAKLELYERMGVREYVVAVVRKKQVLWHVLGRGGYQALAPDAQGIFRSSFFSGLWLDSAALLRLDVARVLAVLQEGIASPEHAAFVERLAKQKR